MVAVCDRLSLLTVGFVWEMGNVRDKLTFFLNLAASSLSCDSLLSLASWRDTRLTQRRKGFTEWVRCQLSVVRRPSSQKPTPSYGDRW